jgi:predicted  nucleic acid-binding Zn-ribbon protein
MTSEEQHTWLMRELDSIKKNTDTISADLSEVKDRVTRLEERASTTNRLIGVLIALVPVLYLVLDHLSK